MYWASRAPAKTRARCSRSFPAGRHSVLTGVNAGAPASDAERRSFVETTHVHFSPIPKEEIARYLATGEPFDKAGSMRFRAARAVCFRRIEGCISILWVCRWRVLCQEPCGLRLV